MPRILDLDTVTALADADYFVAWDTSEGATVKITAENALVLSLDSFDLDDLEDGTTYGRILKTDISAGHIKLTEVVGDLDDVDNGTTYGKVLVTDLSSGHVRLSTCEGDLDDIDNGTSYGKVAVTDISGGHITLATCVGNLDDIDDGSSYGKVALTSISAGKIIVAGLDSGVTALMFTDGDTKTNIENWRHASDATLIDGGDIYTGTVTATQIATGTITATQINGTGFGTLSITSGKISIETTDALEIASGGNINVLAGGDIVMEHDDEDPSLIKWHTYYLMGTGYSDWGLSIWPSTANTGSFYLGYDPINYADKPFTQIRLKAETAVYISANDNNASVYRAYSGHYATSDDSYIYLSTEFNNQIKTIWFQGAVANTNWFGPSSASYDKSIDLALSDRAWDDVYADDYNNVADFYYLDEHDDLQTILGIKPSGKVEERTGLPLIDDATLPDWMLTKHKADRTVRGDDDVERKEEKGGVARDPDGKPWVSNKIMFSLLIGAIRELNEKVEKLS